MIGYNIELPRHPAIDIKWGILQSECEKEWKAWTLEVVKLASKNPKLIEEAAKTLYKGLISLGYDYGVNSVAEDMAWEGTWGD